MGVAHRGREGLCVSDETGSRTRRVRGNGRGGALTGAEMRAVARSRLIESRLTPNAISITGLIGALPDGLVEQLAAYGVREVHHATGDAFSAFSGAAWAAAVQAWPTATPSVRTWVPLGSPRGPPLIQGEKRPRSSRSAGS